MEPPRFLISHPLPPVATLQRVRQASMLIESSLQPLRNPTPACADPSRQSLGEVAVAPACRFFSTAVAISFFLLPPVHGGLFSLSFGFVRPFLLFLAQSDCSRAICPALDGDLLVIDPYLRIARPEHAHCLALSGHAGSQGCAFLWHSNMAVCDL